jgi:chloride channel protein, CIC family
MGAVFASAARAPLTSLASVVEMTGDFALTLPVMLAVAIATALSRALSYGTIYTTKLLRRGTDIDRTTPWRALADLKIADAMRPCRRPLPVPPPARAGADGASTAPARAAQLPGPVIYQGDPQVLFATESITQALRQLEVYGHDGLPVLSADGRQIPGWVTAPDVLRAIMHDAHFPAGHGRGPGVREPAPVPAGRARHLRPDAMDGVRPASVFPAGRRPRSAALSCCRPAGKEGALPG